jgi:hypothetical protein
MKQELVAKLKGQDGTNQSKPNTNSVKIIEENASIKQL